MEFIYFTISLVRQMTEAPNINLGRAKVFTFLDKGVDHGIYIFHNIFS